MLDTVDVSSDGQTWITVFVNPATPLYDQGWTQQVVDVTQFKSATFYVRFGFEITLTGRTVSSWNIDDVVIAPCPPG